MISNPFEEDEKFEGRKDQNRGDDFVQIMKEMEIQTKSIIARKSKELSEFKEG